MTESFGDSDAPSERAPVGRFIHDVVDAARDNPIPSALIGVGALWLLARESPLADLPGQIARTGAGLMASARQRLGSSFESAEQAGDESDVQAGDESEVVDFSDDWTEAETGRAQHLLDATPHRLAEQSYNAAQGVKDGAQFVRDSLKDLWDTQPLLAGAIGLAVGAGIAAAFPSTSMETELFGEQAQNLADQAEDLIAETAEQVREAVRPVA